MVFHALSRPLAAGLTAAVLTSCFGAAAVAAPPPAPAPPPASAAPAAPPSKQELTRALRQIVSRQNIDPLIAEAHRQNRADVAKALTDFTASVESPGRLDVVDDVNELLWGGKPLVLEALNLNGPTSADVLYSVGSVLSVLPPTRPTGGVLHAISPLVSVGAFSIGQLLADIVGTRTPAKVAEQKIYDKLAGTPGMPEDLRRNTARGLAQIATA